LWRNTSIGIRRPCACIVIVTWTDAPRLLDADPTIIGAKSGARRARSLASDLFYCRQRARSKNGATNDNE